MACIWPQSMKFVPIGMEIQDRETVEEPFLLMRHPGRRQLVATIRHSTLIHQVEMLPITVVEHRVSVPHVLTNEKKAAW